MSHPPRPRFSHYFFSQPVHPTGLYLRNTLIHILKHTHQFPTAITINRLDRLVSGLLVIPLNTSLAWKLTKELREGEMKKEYLARVWGAFPSSSSG
jgi:tRNA pseudouridine32 synthase